MQPRRETQMPDQALFEGSGEPELGVGTHGIEWIHCEHPFRLDL